MPINSNDKYTPKLAQYLLGERAPGGYIQDTTTIGDNELQDRLEQEIAKQLTDLSNNNQIILDNIELALTTVQEHLDTAEDSIDATLERNDEIISTFNSQLDEIKTDFNSNAPIADWDADESSLRHILNKPELFSGDYNDLLNKPEVIQTVYPNYKKILVIESEPIPHVNYYIKNNNDEYELVDLKVQVLVDSTLDDINEQYDSSLHYYIKVNDEYLDYTYNEDDWGVNVESGIIYYDKPFLDNVLYYKDDDNEYVNQIANIGNTPIYTNINIKTYNPDIGEEPIATINGIDIFMPSISSSIDTNAIINQLNLSSVAFSGDYNDLLNKPSLTNIDYDNIINTPEFSDVALSGNYNDLSNKPKINQYNLFDYIYNDQTDFNNNQLITINSFTDAIPRNESLNNFNYIQINDNQNVLITQYFVDYPNVKNYVLVQSDANYNADFLYYIRNIKYDPYVFTSNEDWENDQLNNMIYIYENETYILVSNAIYDSSIQYYIQNYDYILYNYDEDLWQSDIATNNIYTLNYNGYGCIVEYTEMTPDNDIANNIFRFNNVNSYKICFYKDINTQTLYIQRFNL